MIKASLILCMLMIIVSSKILPSVSNHVICSQGYYADRSKSCGQCPKGCSKCFNALICSRCQQGFQFNPRTSLCAEIGGISLSNLTNQQLASYYAHLIQRRPFNLTRHDWLPSIINLRKVIHEDPLLRMNWEYGISQCNEDLTNLTGDDVLELINIACHTPPSFSHSSMVGFPINSILAELMQNQNGRLIFSNKKVNKAFKQVFQDYRKMLLSKESLEFMTTQSPEGWFSPEASAKIDYSEFKCDPKKKHYGFANWNQWFMREFKPGKRPVGAGAPSGIPQDNIIVNSCESSPLITPIQPRSNVKIVDQFWLKDAVYSLSDMFAAEEMHKEKWALLFEGGTVYQGYLSSLQYHRWHSPIDGRIEDIYQIPGTYYLDQSQIVGYDEDPDAGQSFMAAVATRKVIVIKSKNSLIGTIAIIYIGMAEVSGCIETVKIGQTVKKGQEIGHFEFGGSTHAIIFEKKAKLKFSNALYETGQNGKPRAVLQKLSSFLAEVLPE